MESQRDRANDWRLLLRLVPYAQRNRTLFIVSLGLVVPIALARFAQPWIIGQAISLLRQEPTSPIVANLTLQAGITRLVLLLALAIGLRLTCAIVQGYLVQKLGQEMITDIRDDLFAHVLSLSSRFFDRTPVGRLVTRLTSDVEALGDVFSTGTIGIFSDIMAILVTVVGIFALQWQLATLLLLLLIPVAALIVYFQQQYRQANYRAREELSRLNSMLAENIAGIGVVQLFRRERFNTEQFRAINQHYLTEVDRTIFHDSAVSATLEWIAWVAIASVLWLGSLLVLRDTITLGLLSAFILYSQQLFNPLRQFGEKFTMIQAGFTAIERVSELLDEPVDIRDPGDRESSLTASEWQAAKTQGEICFEHVWFGYKPGEFVLEDLNFTLRPGEKVALVGPTGAGKSSIVRLLCRLYEPTQGRILVDGIDIRDLRQAELRRYIGTILQESFLFAGDVQRNITLGETYSLEAVKAAAAATNVDHFIEQLPQGYATQLRERGTNLSAGQKQLLAFARVAIRDPRILVMDEATANLDPISERMVQEALGHLLAGRTAIIIAHRLSTIRDVDRILVLKRGRVVEEGDQETLLAQNGLYASLYRLQMLGLEQA